MRVKRNFAPDKYFEQVSGPSGRLRAMKPTGNTPSSRDDGPLHGLSMLLLATFAGLVITGLSGLTAGAAAQSIPMDYESHERMKADLAGRVVLIEVLPKAGAFEVPSLVPLRFGEGVVLVREGRAVIVTSWFLVTEAASLTILSPDGGVRADATIEKELPESGLAVLSLPAAIASAANHPPASAGVLGAPDRARIFFCVSPVSPGTFVLTETVVVDRAGPPMDALLLAPGVLAPGTVLFDGAGVPYAVAARESYSGNGFTIVAPLQPPPPAPASPQEDTDVPQQ